MKYAIIGFVLLIIGSFINYYVQSRIYNKDLTNWYEYLYSDVHSLTFLGLIVITQIPLIIKYDITVGYGIYSILTILLMTISWIDIKTKKIPNILVIIGVILGLISIFFNNDINIYSSMLGAAVLSSALIFISLITKGALGMGDAKIIFVIGLFLGLRTSFSVLLLSIMISGIISLFLLIFRVVKRKTTIPFAPFILISAFYIIIMN